MPAFLAKRDPGESQTAINAFPATTLIGIIIAVTIVIFLGVLVWYRRTHRREQQESARFSATVSPATMVNTKSPAVATAPVARPQRPSPESLTAPAAVARAQATPSPVDSAAVASLHPSLEPAPQQQQQQPKHILDNPELLNASLLDGLRSQEETAQNAL
ncbi:hypothetical protein RI367_002637 [Sorochytrium milnesiophthora]